MSRSAPVFDWPVDREQLQLAEAARTWMQASGGGHEIGSGSMRGCLHVLPRHYPIMQPASFLILSFYLNLTHRRSISSSAEHPTCLLGRGSCFRIGQIPPSRGFSLWPHKLKVERVGSWSSSGGLLWGTGCHGQTPTRPWRAAGVPLCCGVSCPRHQVPHLHSWLVVGDCETVLRTAQWCWLARLGGWQSSHS